MVCGALKVTECNLGRGQVLKENQPWMWDDGKYELVVPGRPTRALRVSVGRPGTTSEYLPSSHIRG